MKDSVSRRDFPATGRKPCGTIGRRSRLAACALGVVAGATAVPAFAQQATQQALKRSVPTPSSGPATCAPLSRPAPPSLGQRAQARSLASRAQQASIIGDYASARDQLREAARLDPSDADIAYRLARAHEQANEAAEAAKEYCRFLALAPTASEAGEARQRVAALGAPRAQAIPEAVVAQFRTAIEHFERGNLTAAEAGFGSVIARAPDWAEPYYNRAVVYAAERQTERAARDYERYLQLRPEAEDRAAVVQRIGLLRQRLLQPSGALARGLLLPGLGQYYTRRPVLGALVLAGVGGAVYLGSRQKRVTRILIGVDPFGNQYEYPDETFERPDLGKGLGVAAGLVLFSAFEAYFHARSLNRDAIAAAAGRRAARDGAEAIPVVGTTGDGVLLGVRFALPIPGR